MPHKYILVGASGTGKSTMAEHLEGLGLRRCTTCTTRPPRPGEVEKGEYIFVNSFDMFSMFEQATFGGHLYGITNDELLKGDFVILDPQGVNYYRENYPGPLTVIKLERNGITVDKARQERDINVDFDKVVPDITVHGDTVSEMSENLIAGIFTYEANRLRETGESPLSDRFLQPMVQGRVSLRFNETEFGLPVACERCHYDYAKKKSTSSEEPCYLNSANYESLFPPFGLMSNRGQSCILEFQLYTQKDESLYFCRLKPENGKIVGELYAEYLQMEPYRFVTKSPVQAVKFAYGGFLAAQADCLGRVEFSTENMKAILTYREAISNGRFAFQEDLNVNQFNSLALKIRIAEAARKYQFERLFQPNTPELNSCER